MEEKKSNNLPVEVKYKGLKSVLKNSPGLGKFADVLRRTGIISGSFVTAFVGIGMTSIGILPVTIAGCGTFLAGAATAVRNVVNKTEPSLLFTSKKRGDTITISQDPLNIVGAEKLRGYSDWEKASIMGLQTLVGFSRYKQNFRNEPFELDENGQKIYAPKLSTVTHSVNLENLECLQTLGYIKIDSMDENFPLETLDEKLFIINENPRRSFLFTEKLGFRNFKGFGNAVKAARSKDRSLIEGNTRIMKKVTFRLTDKPIDFEEIIKFSDSQHRKTLPEEQRKAALRLGRMSRIMKSQHLSIEQDAFGRDVIKYPSLVERNQIIKNRKEERIKAEEGRKARRSIAKFDKQKEMFDKTLQDGIDKHSIGIISHESERTTKVDTKENIEEK